MRVYVTLEHCNKTLDLNLTNLNDYSNKLSFFPNKFALTFLRVTHYMGDLKKAGWKKASKKKLLDISGICHLSTYLLLYLL